jgi:hypothetical protein
VLLACFVSTVLAACGGGTPAAPTPTQSRNPLLHAILTSQLSVQFWFEFNPERNTSISPGQSYSIQMHCRPSQSADYQLTAYFDPLRPDGSILSARSPSLTEQLGATNIGVGMNLCAPGSYGLAVGQLPPEPFKEIPQVKIRVWLRPAVALGSSPNFSPLEPDMVVYEAVNWSCRSPFTGPQCPS